jgi:hypothetical protein
MSQVDPIGRFEHVCSLSEEEKRERRKKVRSELEPALLRREELPDGLAFEFDAAAREQVEELVALERECCAPLSIELLETDTGLRLEMREPRKDA